MKFINRDDLFNPSGFDAQLYFGNSIFLQPQLLKEVKKKGLTIKSCQFNAEAINYMILLVLKPWQTVIENTSKNNTIFYIAGCHRPARDIIFNSGYYWRIKYKSIYSLE